MLAVMILFLSGCGDDKDARDGASAADGEPESGATVGGFGDYSIDMDTGATIVVKLSAEPVDNDLIARTEVVRDDAGIDPVHWVKVQVDASEAAEETEVDGHELQVVTEDGKTVTATIRPEDAIGDWTADADLYNEWAEQTSGFLPGTKGELIVMFDAPIDSVKGVYLDGEPLQQ